MIYIGIVTYNSLADLPACLDGIRAQTYPQIHLTILDNVSSDGTIAWLRAHANDVNLIFNAENVGFGRAHNQIIQQANLGDGDFYLALNPDVRLSPQYVEKLVQGLQEHQADWGIGKLILPETHPPQIYSIGHALMRSGYAFNIGYGLPDGAAFGQSRQIFGAPGAAALYSAKLIRAIQHDGAFFDPQMFMYAEDVDVDWRGQRAGFRCWYIAEANATHRGSQPGSNFQDMALRNRILMVIKNAYWRDLLTINLLTILLHLFARIVLTPRRGIDLARGVLGGTLPTLRKRQAPQRTYQALSAWFQAAKNEPTAIPVSYRERLANFRQKTNAQK